jgi:hypothetical protein
MLQLLMHHLVIVPMWSKQNGSPRCGGVLPAWADQEGPDLFRNQISIMIWLTHPRQSMLVWLWWVIQIDGQKVFFENLKRSFIADKIIICCSLSDCWRFCVFCPMPCSIGQGTIANCLYAPSNKRKRSSKTIDLVREMHLRMFFVSTQFSPGQKTQASSL